MRQGQVGAVLRALLGAKIVAEPVGRADLESLDRQGRRLRRHGPFRGGPHGCRGPLLEQEPQARGDRLQKVLAFPAIGLLPDLAPHVRDEREQAERGVDPAARNFVHRSGVVITLSGNPRDDAKPYQEKAVCRKIEEALK